MMEDNSKHKNLTLSFIKIIILIITITLIYTGFSKRINAACGVSWSSGLVYWTLGLVMSAAECSNAGHVISSLEQGT